MPFLYAMDFMEVLKKKHASGTYKEMVRTKENSLLVENFCAMIFQLF